MYLWRSATVLSVKVVQIKFWKRTKKVGIEDSRGLRTVMLDCLDLFSVN